MNNGGKKLKKSLLIFLTMKNTPKKRQNIIDRKNFLA